MFSSFKTTCIPLLIVFISFLKVTETAAQKFQFGIGYSLFSDVIAIVPQDNIRFQNTEEPRVAFNYFSMSTDMKFILYEIRKDLGVSLAANPCIGVGRPFDPFTLGNIRVPVFAQLDWGMLSTRFSDKSVGYSFGIGYQLERYNLMGEASAFSFTTMAAKLAIYFGDSRSFALKIGLPKIVKMPYTDNVRIDGKYFEFDVYSRVTTFQLSYSRYY